MTPAQLIKGLLDIQHGAIPTDCIVDMAPEIIACIKISAVRESGLRPKTKEQLKITKTIELILYDSNKAI